MEVDLKSELKILEGRFFTQNNLSVPAPSLSAPHGYHVHPGDCATWAGVCISTKLPEFGAWCQMLTKFFTLLLSHVS